MSDDFNIDAKNFLPLRDVVYNSIRDAIITGKIAPGERLMEKQLAEKIGVSRTPIREALHKLELEGFLEMIPRKGAMVTILNEKDIKDVLEIRASLEGLAAKLACENMTDLQIKQLKIIKIEFINAVSSKNLDMMIQKDIELHDLILNSTNNKRLIQFINNLSEQIYRFRLTYLNDEIYRQEITEEHSQIVGAIEQRNSALAESLSLKHIKNQEKAVIKSIKK